ncbi:MAG: leucyl/phenylalanyl-tRNA--protein transferase [Burkholderiales bacterium]|jgi:leucyl/phenylalanyl-tRNA--protein transferase|nr:leucyl/phenylalanyl-tRNA--protein transferase [Burkholderiales bacterium]
MPVRISSNLWFVDGDDFPSVETAETDGPIAISHGLTPEQVVAAYRNGIFPWSSDRGAVLWWSPDPRMVLVVDDFKCSRSLRKTLRSGVFDIREDSAFVEVMQACASVSRRDQEGTWIAPEFIEAYSVLHDRGVAHSVETWCDGQLVGGLYGLQIGRFFFGESMFSYQRDASKAALAHLVARLKTQGITHIDCQQETAHLTSLGARPIARTAFLALLKAAGVTEKSDTR